VLVPSFLESSPLGRAEWIVVTGLLVGRFDEAVSRFQEVERGYQALAARVAETRDASRPGKTVVTGGPWDDIWYVPGGRSYAARFLADAGARYLWADDDSTGAMPLDIETVYEVAVDADLWLYPSSWRSLAEIAEADERLADFRSFQLGEVYGNDRRTNEFGGNDFWESGVARPDLVLADLVKIFHPEMLPEHELVYHRRLPQKQKAGE
jgi:iron complex transport system substrate-binding protein